MTRTELEKEFELRFNQEPEAIFFCPGRVNLIGEHIDYNGGRVMPCAISRGTYLAVRKNTDKKLRFQCINFPETIELSLQDSYTKTGHEWYNYPLGVINYIVEEGHGISGMDMLFFGNLPIGAGLSSSASIEVLMGFTLSQLFGLNIGKQDIAILSKETENKFIGMNCGIMDQFAVSMGVKNQAILLNCDTLEYQLIPFEIGDYVLAIINSRKERKLTDSKYNERFAECRKSLSLLQQKLDINHLCDIGSQTLADNLYLINDSILEKRTTHVITENERVDAAAEVLKGGDLVRFGELMYASHQSLRDLYEVSGSELDVIVDFCKVYKDCLGARMTGAGFGGCAIALIKKDSFQDFSSQLISYYKEKIGYEPEVFASNIGDGVHLIN